MRQRRQRNRLQQQAKRKRAAAWTEEKRAMIEGPQIWLLVDEAEARSLAEGAVVPDAVIRQAKAALIACQPLVSSDAPDS
jgi:hypothetical protein